MLSLEWFMISLWAQGIQVLGFLGEALRTLPTMLSHILQEFQPDVAGGEKGSKDKALAE